MSDSVTVHLSERDLRLVRNALRTYVNAFGHNEAEVVTEVRGLLDRLPETVSQVTADR
ncbi:hypothetical protein SAMN04515671_4084 [Nakamurella panacisegetis]|uniref:Uncharacterized protein n=1 Tax=Nakamurella panacisegetis TaxID=1090615 RepID=A0A1H0SFZ3_9ACTN|nr:hypothetical protein [Nakamurella panacisegetis]SDP40663.1 hypothetical protein SAMN04515671_4084 [Nakamurella panacisegetis]